MRKISIALFAIILTTFSCQKSDSIKDEIVDVPAPEELLGRRCAADEILQKQIAEDPLRAAVLEDLERKTKIFRGKPVKPPTDPTDPGSTEILYVPVVVHIVLPDPDIVTNAHIQSQIDVLNDDFSKSNSELSNSNVYLAGYNFNDVPNCAIQFVVTSVIRKTSATATFGLNDAVKKTSQGGSDAVDATTKLNMWVCDLSSGYLGYAQFPGGSAATDGVVIDYQAFGLRSASSYPMYTQFDLGRTATHEVGHWVNLRHIWGDRRCGDDLVGDTPQHDGSNGGCPRSNLRSNCTGKPLEQWMNYMDYTDDACMYMFTSGQKLRMDAAIENARKPYFLATAPNSGL